MRILLKIYINYNKKKINFKIKKKKKSSLKKNFLFIKSSLKKNK